MVWQLSDAEFMQNLEALERFDYLDGFSSVIFSDDSETVRAAIDQWTYGKKVIEAMDNLTVGRIKKMEDKELGEIVLWYKE